MILVTSTADEKSLAVRRRFEQRCPRLDRRPWRPAYVPTSQQRVVGVGTRRERRRAPTPAWGASLSQASCPALGSAPPPSRPGAGRHPQYGGLGGAGPRDHGARDRRCLLPTAVAVRQATGELPDRARPAGEGARRGALCSCTACGSAVSSRKAGSGQVSAQQPVLPEGNQPQRMDRRAARWHRRGAQRPAAPIPPGPHTTASHATMGTPARTTMIRNVR
jgi:hypothetical protein